MAVCLGCFRSSAINVRGQVPFSRSLTHSKAEKTLMHITLSPLGRGRFRASIDGRVLAESRTPLFDAARTLSREGVPAETVLTMSHESSLIVSMVSTVGQASRFTVIERDDRSPIFESYRPHPSQDAPRSVAVAPQTAIADRRDESPSQTENAFTDDHGREGGRSFPFSV